LYSCLPWRYKKNRSTLRVPLIRTLDNRTDSVEWSTHIPAALPLLNTPHCPITCRLGRPQNLSERSWEEKVLLVLPVFETRNVHSVAKHNSDYTPRLKYLSTVQYRDDLSSDRLQFVSNTVSWRCKLLLPRGFAQTAVFIWIQPLKIDANFPIGDVKAYGIVRYKSTQIWHKTLVISELYARPTERSSKNSPIILGVCVGSIVVLDANGQTLIVHSYIPTVPWLSTIYPNAIKRLPHSRGPRWRIKRLWLAMSLPRRLTL